MRMQRVLTNLSMLCGITAGMASLTPALAQSPMPDAAQMFQSLDTNGDKQLSLADARDNNRRMLEQILQMAQKGNSGSVSQTEFHRVFEEHQARARGGNRPETGRSSSSTGESEMRRAAGASSGLSDALLQLCDADHDGRLTRAEWNRLPSLWARLDTNSDGVLDQAERDALGQAAPPESSRPAASSRPRNENAPAPRAHGGTSLAGVWRGWVVAGTGENPNAGEMEIQLTIRGNTIDGIELSTRRAPPDGLGSGTFSMTGDGRSGNLDAEQTTGPHAGRTYLGVYEISGDTLRWCVTGRNRNRPSTMATDRGNYLMIQRRQGQ